jgi:hypothetical protein
MTSSSRHHSQYIYQASAYGLAGEIEHPVSQSVAAQASCTLGGAGRQTSRSSKNLDLPSFLCFDVAYTEVGGSFDECHDVHTSYAYSVIEGLNIADVITADRVVSRLTIYSLPHGDEQGEHSYDITGSCFENLRIAGHKIEIPDLVYRSNEQVFMAQCKAIGNFNDSFEDTECAEIDEVNLEEDNIPPWLLNALGELRGTTELSPTFHSRCREAMYAALPFNRLPNEAPKEPHIQITTEYSGMDDKKFLNADDDGSRECKSIAYSIHVPKFGIVRLAELLREPSAIRLKMLRVQICSSVAGNFDVADAEIAWAESHQKQADGLSGQEISHSINGP